MAIDMPLPKMLPPQVITRHGVETPVVLSFTDHRKMLLGRKPLSEFFRESPLTGLDFDLTRDTSPTRVRLLKP
jgi:hypothetical protein